MTTFRKETCSAEATAGVKSNRRLISKGGTTGVMKTLIALLLALAALSAADEPAFQLLLTPRSTSQLERAERAGLIEIAPVHLPPLDAGPCNHYGWPIATMTGDTIVVMRSDIPNTIR
ncbi:MAG: hypothetical protein R3C53_22485 [Pirellulaceae bacterium]